MFVQADMICQKTWPQGDGASFPCIAGGGRVVRRCCVSYITGASN